MKELWAAANVTLTETSYDQAGFTFKLTRLWSKYIYLYYIPSALCVLASLNSFFVKPEVEKLKKIFEIGAEEPSLRKGWVELRQGQLVSNPLDYLGATRLELEICVDQLEGGTQAGPRQERFRDGVAGHDWRDAPRLGAEEPTRAGLPEVEGGWVGKAGHAEMRR